MSTITKKVDDFIEESQLHDIDLIKFRSALVLLLKEQDRDTRHACAEAVLRCSSQNLSDTLIRKDAAHTACINAQTGNEVNYE